MSTLLPLAATRSAKKMFVAEKFSCLYPFTASTTHVDLNNYDEMCKSLDGLKRRCESSLLFVMRPANEQLRNCERNSCMKHPSDLSQMMLRLMNEIGNCFQQLLTHASMIATGLTSFSLILPNDL